MSSHVSFCFVDVKSQRALQIPDFFSCFCLFFSLSYPLSLSLTLSTSGSLGDVSRFTRNFTDLSEVDSYLSLNVSSALSLTASLLQAFPRHQGLRRTVVNLSSLCAQQAFPSWVLYCTGKAARDMMFRVLAEEEADVKVLNYSPGKIS